MDRESGGVAQLGEHLPCKQGVKSSNLSISIACNWIKYNNQYGGVAQLGEHLPCKQGVKSSNLSISIR